MAERTDGAVLPVEIKFRRRIDDADFAALRRFMESHRCRRGVLVTRQTSALDDDRVMVVPLRDFVGLASAMGVGRFAFTPLLPLMQQAGTLSLAQGGALVRANYLGYLVGAVLSCWSTLGTEPSAAAVPRGAPRAALPASTWRLVLAYGAFGFGYIVPATFLPAAARQVVPDPAVFAWTWPVFGLAAAASTMAASRWWREVPPRRLWAGAQVVMAAGVLVPALRMSVATLLWCAVCVGGTFMVVTMTGIQEARRVAGASAARLIAATTAAFAVGQLVGPFTVTSLGSSSSPGVTLPHGIAAAVLLLCVAALALGPAPAPAVTRSLEPGEPT